MHRKEWKTKKNKTDNENTVHMEEMIEELKRQSDYLIVPKNLQPEVLMEEIASGRMKSSSRWKRFRQNMRGLRKIWYVAAAVALVVLCTLLYPVVMEQKIEWHIVEEGGVLVTHFQSQNEVYYYLKMKMQEDEYENIWESLFNTITNQKTRDSAPLLKSAHIEGEENEFSIGGAGTTLSGDDFSINEKGSSGDYIDTTIQTQGVDEADVVKTDGQYIYMVERNQIVIYDTKAYREQNQKKEDGTEDDTVPIVTGISVSITEDSDELKQVQEIYVKDNKIMVIVEMGDSAIVSENGKREEHIPKTYILTYDISDINHIEKIGEVYQQGSYQSSRYTDGIVYLISNYELYEVDSLKKGKCIPMINGKKIDLDKLYIDSQTYAADYHVVTSLKTEQPNQYIDSFAVCSSNFEEYVSNDNIYLYDVDYGDDEDEYYNSSRGAGSIIFKFSFDKGKMKYVGYGKIDGILNDSFSLDEYKGNLRAVTTDLDKNMVFVLDSKLQVISKIDNIAFGETIKSARFMGDMGYFVTYKNTDPVFSVDFSDPYKPEIIGELKVSGFSSYMHFWDEEHILGFGTETNPVTGEELGMKLSMFNISDASNVKEESKYVIQDAYSTATYDYHSILVSGEKNVIGFMDYVAGEPTLEGILQEKKEYRICAYDETGFKTLCIYEIQEWNIDDYQTRGIYIDGEIYLACPGRGVRHIYSCGGMGSGSRQSK